MPTRTSPKRLLLSGLRAMLRRHALEMAHCGSRLPRPPEVSPTDGTLQGRGIYSKPPRWVIHMERDGGTWVASLPAHAHNRRLGYFNARSGRRVGGLAFTLQIATRTSGGWALAGNAEWLIVFVSPQPFPEGTSSETIDDFNFEVGRFAYQGQPWHYESAHLVALEPPSRVLSGTGAGKLTYREATRALRALLRAQDCSSSGAGAAMGFLDLFDSGSGGVTPFISELEIRVFAAGGEEAEYLGRQIEEKVRSHNRLVRERFLTLVGGLRGPSLTDFVTELLVHRGFENIRVRETPDDRERLAVGHCTRRDGVSHSSFMAIVLRETTPLEAKTILMANQQTGDSGCILISTQIRSEGIDQALWRPEYAGIKVLDGGDLCRECEEAGIGMTQGLRVLRLDLPGMTNDGSPIIP